MYSPDLRTRCRATTPVAGLTATRLATGQGRVATEQPGTCNSGALALDHLSGKKFDDCSLVSYCGPWWVNRIP